jgi:5-methylcytosine-specific restriction endonuclease McrA
MPKGWKRLRAQVLQRDSGTCQSCGGDASEVHHVGDPDDHDPARLVSLCSACHAVITQQQAAAGRAAAAERRSQTRPSEKHPGLL